MNDSVDYYGVSIYPKHAGRSDPGHLFPGGGLDFVRSMSLKMGGFMWASFRPVTEFSG